MDCVTLSCQILRVCSGKEICFSENHARAAKVSTFGTFKRLLLVCCAVFCSQHFLLTTRDATEACPGRLF